MNMKIKSSQTLVQEALQDVKTISPEEAFKMFDRDNSGTINHNEIK